MLLDENKRENKPLAHILVGYQAMGNGYICIHPSTKNIVIPQEVIFEELDFSLSSLLSDMHDSDHSPNYVPRSSVSLSIIMLASTVITSGQPSNSIGSFDHFPSPNSPSLGPNHGDVDLSSTNIDLTSCDPSDDTRLDLPMWVLSL